MPLLSLSQRTVAEALAAFRFVHQAEFEYGKDGDDPLPGLFKTAATSRARWRAMIPPRAEPPELTS